MSNWIAAAELKPGDNIGSVYWNYILLRVDTNSFVTKLVWADDDGIEREAVYGSQELLDLRYREMDKVEQ
jgi:hypothetical protein